MTAVDPSVYLQNSNAYYLTAILVKTPKKISELYVDRYIILIKFTSGIKKKLQGKKV